MVLRRNVSDARRKQIKRAILTHRARQTDPTADAVALVVARAKDCCERCGQPLPGVRGLGWSIHHRRGRDGRPDSHTVPNLVALCGGDNVTGCHGFVHSRRTEAQRAGFWLSRVACEDPLKASLQLHDGRRVYLTDDGRYAEAP